MIPEGSRVWALAAVSSKKQDTIDQRRWVSQIVPERSLILGRTFDGKASGKNGLRTIVNDLMDALRQTKKTCPAEMPRYLLMIRPDRLGRGDVFSICSCIDELYSLGVTIWTRDGGQLEFETLEQQLVACILVFLGAIENRGRTNKIKESYDRDGAIHGHRRPYGIRLERNSEERLADVPDGDRAKAVSRAFAMRVDGHTMAEIRRMLDASAPPAKTADKQYTVEWSDSRMNSMFKNEAYVKCGITDQVSFNLVNIPRRTHSHVQRPHKTLAFPLAGAVVCYCGRGLVCGVSNGKHRYYKCVAYLPHQDNRTRSIRAEDIEKQFLTFLREASATPELLVAAQNADPFTPLPELQSQIELYEAELRSLESDKSKLWRLFLKGKIADDDVQPEIDVINKQRLDVEARASQVRGQVQLANALAKRRFDLTDLIKRGVEIFTDVDADEDAQRRIARLIADEVGLCVEADGLLTLRHVESEAAARRRKRK